MGGQGQHKNPIGAGKLFRCFLTAPDAESYSLWLNVDRPEDGVAVIKLAIAQGVELAPGWEVNIEGKRYRGEALVDGKLRCLAI